MRPLIVVVALLTACADDSARVGGVDGVSADLATDLGLEADPALSEVDDPPDAGLDAPDAADDAAGPEPGGFDAGLCEVNSDCASGFCLPGPDGKTCAELCIDNSDCPSDRTCDAIQPKGSVDFAFYCVWPDMLLCQACDDDDHCNWNPNGWHKCVEGTCARRCDEGWYGACSPGFECVEVGEDAAGAPIAQCVPPEGQSCR